MQRKGIYLIISIIFVAAISRFFAPWPNVSPLGAIALLGGAYLPKRWMAALVSVAALWLSNLVLNNVIYAALFDGFVWFGWNFWFVGSAMILIAYFGAWWLKQKRASRLLSGSLIASTLFFLITNFGDWASGLMYPMNMAGLISAYAAGLPFFLNTVLGDLFFVSVLFGIVEWVSRRQRALTTAK